MSFLQLNIFKKKSKNHTFDKKLVFGLIGKKIPTIKQLKYLPHFLSKQEKIVLAVTIALVCISAGALALRGYISVTTAVPKSGGHFIEGMVGQPRFINPLYASSNDVDMDISRLIFSGLVKQCGQDVEPDMAQRYEISSDQKEYTFFLKQNIVWHDGAPFTANDVMFTVRAIQNPAYQSPLLGVLQQATITQKDDFTVSFKLKEPFAPFLSSLTFGIIPEHLWSQIEPTTATLAQLNITNPIGTGPYRFQSLAKNNKGVIHSYTLKKNINYFGDQAHINEITFKFYTDFESAIGALEDRNIDNLSYLPHNARNKINNKSIAIKPLTLPQYTAVFFNPTQSKALQQLAVRKAITLAVDKKTIAETAQSAELQIIDGPILPGFPGYIEQKTQKQNTDQANSLLDQAGWKKITPQEYRAKLTAEQTKKIKDENPDTATSEQAAEITIPDLPLFRIQGDEALSLTITAVNQQESVAVINELKTQLGNIGIIIHEQLIEGDKIHQTIIKPRAYEALLYGEIIGSDPDPYPFWHSSQAKDPGINLAMFTNKKADALLEEARKTTDPAVRAKNYTAFQSIVQEEAPALFLYNPIYSYVLSSSIQGFNTTKIIKPSDRFCQTHEWFIKTRRVFKY